MTMWILCCNYALQPAGSLCANALCLKWQKFIVILRAKPEVSIQKTESGLLKRNLYGFFATLKMTMWVFVTTTPCTLQPVESLCAKALCLKRQSPWHTEGKARSIYKFKVYLKFFGYFANAQYDSKWCGFFATLKITNFAVISKWRSAFSLPVIASEQSERGNP